MRHGIKAKHFNRDANQRKLLLRELVMSLVKYGQISTTMPRAKEVRRVADRLIHDAQTDSLATRRNLHRFFGKRDVVNTLVDRVAPVMGKRQSGFTRIVSVGTRRGDNAPMVTLSLVEMPEGMGSLKQVKAGTINTAETKKKKTKKTVKPVKKVSHQPDRQIQQQARAKEVQTGVKANAPTVPTRVKAVGTSGK